MVASVTGLCTRCRRLAELDLGWCATCVAAERAAMFWRGAPLMTDTEAREEHDRQREDLEDDRQREEK